MHMHVEHSVECKALPGEPSPRQMEHFLHHTQPPETCAQVGALSGALSYTIDKINPYCHCTIILWAIVQQN